MFAESYDFAEVMNWGDFIDFEVFDIFGAFDLNLMLDHWSEEGHIFFLLNKRVLMKDFRRRIDFVKNPALFIEQEQLIVSCKNKKVFVPILWIRDGWRFLKGLNLQNWIVGNFYGPDIEIHVFLVEDKLALFSSDNQVAVLVQIHTAEWTLVSHASE